MEPISFTASAPFAICRKICCLWLAILLILCIITYTSIRGFIFTRISFSTTSSKVDLGQLCFSTSELLSSCIVYGNKIIVIVVVIITCFMCNGRIAHDKDTVCDMYGNLFTPRSISKRLLQLGWFYCIRMSVSISMPSPFLCPRPPPCPFPCPSPRPHPCPFSCPCPCLCLCLSSHTHLHMTAIT